MAMIRLWSDRFTFQDEGEDDPSVWDKLDVDSAYLKGVLDGKTEFARDILEAQDLINYN